MINVIGKMHEWNKKLKDMNSQKKESIAKNPMSDNSRNTKDNKKTIPKAKRKFHCYKIHSDSVHTITRYLEKFGYLG